MPNEFDQATAALDSVLRTVRFNVADPEEIKRRLKTVEDAIATFRLATQMDSDRTDLGAFIEAVGQAVVRAQGALDKVGPVAGPTKEAPATIYRIPEVTAQVKFDVENTRERNVGIIFYKRTTKDVQTHQQSLTCKIAAVPLPPDATVLRESDRSNRRAAVSLTSERTTRAFEAAPATGPLRIDFPDATRALVLEASDKDAVTIEFVDGNTTWKLRAPSRRKDQKSLVPLAQLIRSLGARQAALAHSDEERRAAVADFVLDDRVRLAIHGNVVAHADDSDATLLRQNWSRVVVHRLGRGDQFLLVLGLDPDHEPRVGLWFVDFRDSTFATLRSFETARPNEPFGPFIDVLWDLQEWQRPLVRPEHAI